MVEDKVLSYFIIFYFVIFYYYHVEVCSFLMRNRKGVDFDGREWGWSGRSRYRKTVVRIDAVRREFIFNKINHGFAFV